jgi:environmental stress-induced protein Ves
MNLVRCDAVEPQPWRNGGGLTRELLAWPSRDDWALRISVADIRADGPFSAFPGVDRWFAVLEGSGVLLGLPDGRRSVETVDAPLAFRGESAPPCELLDGPTRDLNLMIRRGAGRGAMQRAQVGEDFAPRAHFRALFTADALMLQHDGSDALRLPAFALAWDAGCAHGVWRIAADTAVRAWWIHFEPGPA